jgi:hypothetical protein
MHISVRNAKNVEWDRVLSVDVLVISISRKFDSSLRASVDRMYCIIVHKAENCRSNHAAGVQLEAGA